MENAVASLPKMTDPSKKANANDPLISPRGFRRKYPRKSFTKKIGLLYRGEYHLVQGNEIGEGGLSFKVNLANKTKHSNIKELDILNVTFQPIPGTFLIINASARNVRVSGDEKIIGVQFENLSFETKRFIRNFITTRIKD